MPTSNLKVFLAIILSVILFFGGRYVIKKPEVFSVDSLISHGKIILSNLSNIKLPSFKINSLLTLKQNKNNNLNNNQLQIQNNDNYFILPTVNTSTKSIYFLSSPTREIKKQTNTIISRTKKQNNTIIFPTPASYIYPTEKIKPNKIPKPTKDNSFPIDESLLRYGSNSEEVFQKASELTCVPKEVLKAISRIESGGFFDNVSSKYFKLYNSYNWWNSEFLTDPKIACSGYNFDTNTGLIPEDSKFAGYKCREGSNSGLTTFGPMQISDYWLGKFKPKAAQLLKVDHVDQRVILDAIVIAGLSINTNVKPSNCNSWTGWEVAKAACSYYGSCGFKDGSYYCNTFCRNYKQFGGKTNCQEAVNKMQDNCWQPAK